MERILREADYNVLTEPNGKEILSVLASTRVDLVLTDLVMPEKDGIEVLLSMRPKYRHIPVVAISAWGSQSTRNYLRTARAFGSRASIEKPFTRATLLATLRSVLEPESRPAA